MKFKLMIILLIFKVMAQITSPGLMSPTTIRVETAIKKFESVLSQIDELERQALINIDKEFQLMPRLGASAMDIMTQQQRIKELKEIIRRAKDLQPRMLSKMKEILKVVPKRERFRLIRRLNLRHRFSLGTELDTA